MNFLLPKNFDNEDVSNSIVKMKSLVRESILSLDFRRIYFVDPFHTLLMAIAIRELIDARLAKGLITKVIGTDANNRAISYLRYMGFFQFLDGHVGNQPNQASSSERYLPITIISRGELEQHSLGKPIQYEIDKHSDRLAKVIFPDSDDEGPAMMLSYCFREVIRNSFEHAEVDDCIVMAQRWGDGNAEISIADRGIGIYTSLKSQHTVTSATAAITLSLLPGITSGADRASGSEWDNSGFGLYIISELGRRYGEFAMLSSGKLVTVNNETLAFRKESIPTIGTIVKLKINTSDGDYFPNILNEIVAAGEKSAIGIVNSVKKASKMSKTTKIDA